MSPEEKDLVRIKHIKDAVDLISEFTTGISESEFFKNKMIQAAVMRQFEIIGEASANISNNTRKQFPEVEWRLMKAFRNFLIHEYFKVDAAELWYSIKYDIPVLNEEIIRVLGKLNE